MTAVAKSLADAFTSAMAAGITKAAAAWIRAEDGVTRSRLNFGRAVGKAAAAIIAAGGSDDDARDLIWPTVEETTGHRVDWDTVKAWTKAANVYDSLPKSVADVFSDEGLRTLARIPVKLNDTDKAAGKVDRETFATIAADSGCTTVRDLRKAVKAERASGDSKRTAKRNASQAEETVKVLREIVTLDIAVHFQGVSPDVLTAAVMIGVMLRDKVQKHNVEAVLEGVTEYFTPATVETDDGSGAPDTQ